MPKLKIIGWKTGLRKITMTQILRAEIFPSLAEAKMCVGDVLAGKKFEFDIEDKEKLRRIAKELEEIGAIIEVETY